MNKKNSLFAIILTTQALMTTEVCANSSPQRSIQYYGGLSGGFNRMGGKRSEDAFHVNDQESFIFTKNLNIKDNNTQYSGFVGFSWFIPQTCVFIGPEIHLGKSHTEKKFQGSLFDQGSGNYRTLSSTFSQSIFWGAVARLGYFYHSYSGYVLLGGEGSQFQNSVAYTTLDPTRPSLFFKSNKWLKGILWGFGIEKFVKNCVKFGIEARFINYGTLRASYVTNVVPDTLNTRFKPNNMRFSVRLSYVF